MKDLILASTVALACLCTAAEASPAAPWPHYIRVQAEEYARIECIMPWYRFFGACPEAVDVSPTGDNSNGGRRRHHHHW
jgi:hypothetical protein